MSTNPTSQENAEPSDDRYDGSMGIFTGYGETPEAAKDDNHTPTPWFVENIMHGGPRIVYGETDAGDPDEFRCDVPLHGAGQIQQANAAFIVRAVNSHASDQRRIKELETEITE